MKTYPAARKFGRIPSVMRPRIKICGLTRREDIRLAREFGADFFGVILYAKSPRYVSEDDLTALLPAIPKGKRVAVEVAPVPGILKKRLAAGFDLVQVHYDPDKTTAGSIQDWANEVGRERLWLAPHLPPGREFPAEALAAAQTLLLDTYQKGTYGGSGRTGDWPHFKALREAHPKHHWVLSGGLNPENIRNALKVTQAEIIDVNSGVETSPGVKCALKLDMLFANLSGL
jgi:phosphoribosylanthranilate isomerase